MNRRAAMALAALLDPAAVMALALALWGIAAARAWVGSFAIASGVFSHWETWLGAAAALGTVRVGAEPLRKKRRSGSRLIS